mgnify:CR=1 FL=1
MIRVGRNNIEKSKVEIQYNKWNFGGNNIACDACWFWWIGDLVSYKSK